MAYRNRRTSSTFSGNMYVRFSALTLSIYSCYLLALKVPIHVFIVPSTTQGFLFCSACVHVHTCTHTHTAPLEACQEHCGLLLHVENHRPLPDPEAPQDAGEAERPEGGHCPPADLHRSPCWTQGPIRYGNWTISFPMIPFPFHSIVFLPFQ